MIFIIFFSISKISFSCDLRFFCFVQISFSRLNRLSFFFFRCVCRRIVFCVVFDVLDYFVDAFDCFVDHVHCVDFRSLCFIVIRIVQRFLFNISFIFFIFFIFDVLFIIIIIIDLCSFLVSCFSRHRKTRQEVKEQDE